MKKNDIALIVLIVSVSLVVAYFGAKAIIGDAKNDVVQVEVVEPILPDVVEPSAKIFNKDAINPTVDIEIGNSANAQPFGSN